MWLRMRRSADNFGEASDGDSNTTSTKPTTPTPKSTPSPTPTFTASMTLSSLQLDAFRLSSINVTNFQTPAPCEPPEPRPNDLIPIIVGCVLAAMVVVVLVAYLIGRRYRASSYEELENSR